MGLLNIASNNSVWRGLDYYNSKKVKEFSKVSNYEYEGLVLGNNKEYNTFINIEHPRKSRCNCKHAKDKRIICKHMIALYFTVLPSEVNIFLKEVEEEEKRTKEYNEIIYNKMLKYINSLPKSELINIIVELFNVSPNWVYDRFVKERIEEVNDENN